MIIEAIYNFFYWIAKTFISLFPTLNINVEPLENILNESIFFQSITYFLPLGTILTVCALYWSVDIARLIIAIIVRVKSFIPFFGGD